ncbi:hypothetical protein ACS0TY_002770 [Phlomoides rotata]
MAKATTTLCLTTLLLLLAFSHVLARVGPAFHDVTPMENPRAEKEGQKAAVDRDSCVGLREDECMMRKTIEAHLDYMYAQKQQQQ